MFLLQTNQKAKELKKRFKASINSEIEDKVTLTSINGFDFPKTPIITNQKPNEIQLFHWGLVPHWAKDNTLRTSTLNAKIETLTEKPSFKHIISNRCLILSDGFYEWKWNDTKGKNKDKHLITLSENELFTFAGLYDTWIDSYGNSYNSYTIITAEAEGLMREVHNSKLRMPLILSREDELNWLEGIDSNEIVVPTNIFKQKKPKLQSRQTSPKCE